MVSQPAALGRGAFQPGTSILYRHCDARRFAPKKRQRVRDSSGGDLRAEKGTAPCFSEPRPSGRGVSADAPGPLPYGLATERGSASLRARFGNTWGRRLPTSRPKCHALSANPHAGKFRAEASLYLSNACYTGYSDKTWYLLADPNDLPVIEAAFLNGQESPTIETAEADSQHAVSDPVPRQP